MRSDNAVHFFSGMAEKDENIAPDPDLGGRSQEVSSSCDFPISDEDAYLGMEISMLLARA